MGFIPGLGNDGSGRRSANPRQRLQLDDIIGQLGSEFPRLRIGIAPDLPTPMKMTDYVLGKFSPEEINTLATCWERILSEMSLIIQKGPNLAINTINQRILKNEPTKKSEISSDLHPGHPRVRIPRGDLGGEGD